MTVGENIRRIRLEKGLTQKALGELSNINESQIRRYELGLANSNPKLDTIKKIAAGLDVSAQVLLDGCGIDFVEITTEDFIINSQKEGTKKLISHIDSIGYAFRADSEGNAWIEYPDGKEIAISMDELDLLNDETDSFLKFKLEELRKKKEI